MTSLLDILPTVASVITNEEDDSKNTFGDKLDGVSMLSLLKNQSNLVEKKDRLVYHFCDSEIFAMRTQFDGVVYKLILREPLLSSSGSCQGIYTLYSQLFSPHFDFLEHLLNADLIGPKFYLEQ